MRLAGEEELDGPVVVVHQPVQTVHVAQEQGGPLVSGEPAGEADGENVRVQGPRRVRGRGAPFRGRARSRTGLRQTGVDPVHQARPERRPQPPQLLVGDLPDRGPVLPAPAVPPPAVHPLVQQRLHLGRQPRVQVDPVRDVAHRDLVHRAIGPDAAQHGAAHRSVQAAHAVPVSGDVQRQDRHGEELLGTLHVVPAQCQDAVQGLVQLPGERGEVGGHELGREPVVARRDRRVRREDVALGRGLDRLFEGQPVPVHEHPDLFQDQEGGVPLVQVVDPWSDAHGVQGAQPPDPQDDLLGDARLVVAAVQPRRDGPVVGVVGVQVRVQQVQRHPAHPGPPDAGEDRPSREGQGGDGEIPAVRITQTLQRKGVGIQAPVRLGLLAGPGNVLPEVAFPVEQSDSHQRDAQVAGRLEMVPGQDAQAARVHAHALRQAELRREVGGDRVTVAVVDVVEPAAGRLQVAVQVGGQLADARRDLGIPDALLERLTRHAPEQLHGVVPRVLPQLRIHLPEQPARGVVPCPAKIGGQGLEAFERSYALGPGPVRRVAHHRPRRWLSLQEGGKVRAPAARFQGHGDIDRFRGAGYVAGATEDQP